MGQQFVPGALAATVKEWVVEASQPLWQNRHKGDEEWDFRFQIGDVTRLEGLGGGVMLIRSSDGGAAGEREKGWVLMAQGKGREKDDDLSRGMGGRCKTAPTWEIRLGEEEWGVAVEWTVLVNAGRVVNTDVVALRKSPGTPPTTLRPDRGPNRLERLLSPA
ncbi:MAG: hypothetical protein LQ341_007515 [Variospora aurantia]|nr:MAG: hypothetical protein LQ341_007515 [Variospora aurantia]